MLDPPAAGGDLPDVGLVVDPPLAACHELEMLDRVGDVDLRAVDPGLFQRRVEKLAGGPDKRPAGKILLVAGLFADEHDRGIQRPFAEHRLGAAFIKLAAGAFARILEQRFPGSAHIPARFDLPLCVERMLEALFRD